MEWHSGISSRIRCYRVELPSWNDGEEVPITGGTVDRAASGTLESADLELSDSIGKSWVRVYMDVTQDGDARRVPVFTGLSTSPKRQLDGITKRTAECVSPLQVADDVLLERGWYCPVGFPAAKMVGRLLGVFGIRVSIADDSPALSSALVAEDDETNLSMAWKLVEAINWTIRLEGDGTVRIEPKSSTVTASFDALLADMVEPDVTDEMDTWGVPNVLRVTNGDETAIARDDSPDSALSTVSCGREVWAQESDPALSDGESLSGYAQRRLKVLQQAERTISYKRRFHPDVRCGDIVELDYPGHDLVGQFEVVSQRISLSENCRTEEEVRQC